jgi:hypothetical protein
LIEARDMGLKATLKMAFALGLLGFSIFATYAYSFFMGSVFIDKKIKNNTFNRVFTAGDVVCCFFGVVFGL